VQPNTVCTPEALKYSHNEQACNVLFFVSPEKNFRAIYNTQNPGFEFTRTFKLVLFRKQIRKDHGLKPAQAKSL
jgi:hypothetical protein